MDYIIADKIYNSRDEKKYFLKKYNTYQSAISEAKDIILKQQKIILRLDFNFQIINCFLLLSQSFKNKS